MLRLRGELLLNWRWCSPLSAVLLLVLFASEHAWPQDQKGPPPHDHRGPPPDRGYGPYGPPSFSREPEEPVKATVSRGYVFLEGAYLSPPYEIREETDAVSINGQRLKCLLPSEDSGRGGGGPRGEGSRGFSRGTPAHQQAAEIKWRLDNGGVVLAFSNQQLIWFDSHGAYALLKVLTTDAAGKFVMGTNDVGDGATVGKHKVAIVWVPPAASGTPGQEAIVDDPSKLPKPKVKIPDKYGNPETSGLEQEVPARGVQDLKIDLQ